MSTNVTEFIEELDVGSFKEKLGTSLSEVKMLNYVIYKTIQQ